MKNKYYLFLDDERSPSDYRWMGIPDLHWTVVKNYNVFKTIIELKTYLPEVISFDHDLKKEHYKNLVKNENDYSKYIEKTGYDCAKWLVDYCRQKKIRLPKYTVHSLNPIGAQNIKSILQSYEKQNSI